MPRQLMKKAGFALVKSFRVKRFGEIIKLVIQVMADLVQQRPQKGPEGHDQAPLRSAHPTEITAEARPCAGTYNP